MLRRSNNPTSNILPISDKKPISTIKPSYTDLKDLEILCNHCSTFGKKEGEINKVIMRHDTRNELYQCPKCNRVTSENQIRYVMRLELPEYHNYEKTNPTVENINNVNKERQTNEKFVIKPINSESPDNMIKRRGAKVISSNDKK